MLKSLYYFYFRRLPTLIYALISGLKYNPTHIIRGRIRVYRNKIGTNIFRFLFKGGKIEIGDYFECNNSFTSNSIGCFQHCFFNVAEPGSLIKIGNNVGISGSSIKAKEKILIGNNVLIGSGCLLSDSDSHPVDAELRFRDRNQNVATSPIVVEDDVFIGARCIILKGVTIGKGCVIGAGSVVSKDCPPHTIVCGNPAVVVKTLNYH